MWQDIGIQYYPNHIWSEPKSRTQTTNMKLTVENEQNTNILS